MVALRTTRHDHRAMDRDGRRFRRHWHHRRLRRADGEVLTWLVVDPPGRHPFIADFRSDSGGVYEDDGYRCLPSTVIPTPPSRGRAARGSSSTDGTP